MKKEILAAAAVCAVLFSAGCTQSNILNPDNSRPEPDFTVVTDVVLEWGQISEDVLSYYEGMEGEYPGLLYFNFAHNDEENLVTAQLYVDDSVDGETAAAYARDLICYINDAVCMQNHSLEYSTDDSYGSFFDDYSFQVQVIPDETLEDESTWLVNMTVEAGTNAPIVPVDAADGE